MDILNLDEIKRPNLFINEFDFLRAFKDKDELTFFRLIHEVKGFSRNESCILTMDDHDEYPFIKETFKRYQRKGHGVYFVVNSGGTKKQKINRINSHILDMDFGKVPQLDKDGNILKDSKGKTLYTYRTKKEINVFKTYFIKTLKTFPLFPNIIIETKNGFHIYWLIYHNNKAIKLFTPLQEKIIEYFGEIEIRKEHADQKVKTIERVMRIPNYNHLKNPNDPFKIKCIWFDMDKKYTQKEIADSIDVDLTELENSLPSNKLNTTKKNVVKEKKQINIPKRFSSNEIKPEEIFSYLRSQNITEFLNIDVEVEQSFNCIFHKDKHPSACISVTPNGGYKYFCNSTNCTASHDNGIDIVDIVELQDNCNVSEALKKLIDYYDIKIVDKNFITQHSKKYTYNFSIINNNEFIIEKFPKLNRIIQYGYLLLYEISLIGKNCIINSNFLYKDQNVFFFSNRYLASRVNRPHTKVNKYINLFCILGLLNKVPHSKIHKTFRINAEKVAKESGQSKVNFYTVPKYSKSILENAEETANYMLSTGFSIKGISKKYIENCFGIDVANKIYLMPIKDSKFGQDIREKIEHIILDQIRQSGYCTKKILMSIPIHINNKLIKNTIIEYEFRRALPDILIKYDLKYVYANKNINTTLESNVKGKIIIQSKIIND